MTILIEINNGQAIPLISDLYYIGHCFDVVYFYSLIFFRISALENIAKILTTGPRLSVLRNWIVYSNTARL